VRSLRGKVGNGVLPRYRTTWPIQAFRASQTLGRDAQVGPGNFPISQTLFVHLFIHSRIYKASLQEIYSIPHDGWVPHPSHDDTNQS